MVSAVISVFLGLVAFVTPIPIVLPVLGLALGANGYIRESKMEPQAQRKRIKVASIVGMACCGLWVVFTLL